MKPARFSKHAFVMAGLLTTACAAEGFEQQVASDQPYEDVEIAGQVNALVYSSASFSMTGAYYGHTNGACSSSTLRNIAGSEPAEAGTYPVFVFLTGTTMPFNGADAQQLTSAMAQRGFVAATVQYDNGSYPSCGAMQTKAKCIWDAANPKSAINAICSRPKADCATKGIVVSGFSQGANLAALSKNYDARVRGAFLMGHGNKASGLIDVSSCSNNAATALLPSQMRSVNGESDSYFGGSAAGVRAQLSAVVGVRCGSSAYNCLQADGSGWFMVSNASLSDRKADHCYFFNGASSNCSTFSGFDTTWSGGTIGWSKETSLNWLAAKATP